MKLKKRAHIHLMGICGTAMASLAGLLKSMGYRITGSDQNVYPPMSTQLESLGIDIMEGYKKENLQCKPDLVIVGNVITRKHEEARFLLNSDIPYTSLPKAMGEFVIGSRNSVMISGTHGKTTTTALLAWVAQNCVKDPGFLIGGIPQNFSHSFQEPKGDWFVIEGDEYDTAFFDKVPKFMHYKPKYVVLSSIEFDHADIYDDIEQIKSIFKQLVQMIPPEGILVANADDDNIQDLLPYAQCKVVTYGLECGDYRAVDREVVVGRNQFAVEKNGQRMADLALKLFGPHNTLNSLSAFTLAIELGWPMQKVLQSMADFKGVKRRQELIGEVGGIKIIEDFAHHPTAVKLTLQTMKEQFPKSRIIAVFEPRSATTRRNIFQKDYAKAFQQADLSLIAEAFNQASIPEEQRFSSQRLVADIAKLGGKAYFMSQPTDIVKFLVEESCSEDIILIMSNGSFGGIYQDLIQSLH